MKQSVLLFIEDEQVDVFESGSINIQSSIKDLRDPGKIFTDFSRDFTLPASKRNNKVFKHFYNYHIDEGYDATQAREARIEINNKPFRQGYIMLEGVDMKVNRPYSYKVTFYGNTRFIKEQLENTKLSELTFLDNVEIIYEATGTNSIHEYLTTSKNVTINSVSHIQPVVVPLITHTERLYYNSSKYDASSNPSGFYGQFADGNLYYDAADYPLNSERNGVSWEQLKPAVRVDFILKAIEDALSKKTGQTITFSTDFLNSSNLDYYNLYMWLHQKEGKIRPVGSEGEIQTRINTFNIGTYISYQTNGFKAFTAEVFNAIDNSTGQAGSKIQLVFNSELCESVIMNLSLISTSSTIEFQLLVIKDGFQYFSDRLIPHTSVEDGSVQVDLDPGLYEFLIITKSTDSSTINFDSGFNLSLTPRMDYPDDIGILHQDISADAKTIPGGAKTTNVTPNFLMSQNLPDINIIEFLTSLFKMFNLVAEVENTSNTSKVIKVKTLDQFYASSTTSLDITNSVDISQSNVSKSLPYTRVVFKYEDVGSMLAKQHSEMSGITWGGELYDVKEHNDGATLSRYSSDYEIEPAFGHMKFERLLDANDGDASTELMVGFSVTKGQEDPNEFNEEKYNPYIGKPVLFYPILKPVSSETPNTIPYVYNKRAASTTISTYFIPSNTVKLETSATNHFGAEESEWEVTARVPSYEDNLFSNYYTNYIKSIFRSKNRILSIKANLTNAFMSNYSLADKIIYSGDSYFINKIKSDITNGKSDIELIRSYNVIDFLCLETLFEVRVETITGGYLYIFNNKYGIYQLNNGTYTFNSVPSAHPIAFHNSGKTSLITYSGTVVGGTKTGLDGNTYTYYSGDITVVVSGDFGTISYECYNHGYMGGQNNITYDSSCLVGTTTPPVTGTLTVDATDISVDSALITADQTDE